MEEKGFPNKTVRKTMRGQIDTSSPAVRVIKDNTGTSIMKIIPFQIEGLTKKGTNIKSFFSRAIVYANQGIEILRERRRIAKYQKHGKPPQEAAAAA